MGRHQGDHLWDEPMVTIYGIGYARWRAQLAHAARNAGTASSPTGVGCVDTRPPSAS